MRLILISISLGFSLNVYALDSALKFTTTELNEAPIVASSDEGTDYVTTAGRVIQLQLRASGCSNIIVTSPQMFEKRSDYTFEVKSDNCVVKLKSDKCDSSYSPRNMKQNPNSKSNAIIGGDKYVICLKGSSDTSEGTSRTDK